MYGHYTASPPLPSLPRTGGICRGEVVSPLSTRIFPVSAPSGQQKSATPKFVMGDGDFAAASRNNSRTNGNQGQPQLFITPGRGFDRRRSSPENRCGVDAASGSIAADRRGAPGPSLRSLPGGI